MAEELKPPTTPLDEAQYAKMQELANKSPELKVSELVAKSDELVGTDPTTLKNYLVDANVDITAATVGDVDMVQAKEKAGAPAITPTTVTDTVKEQKLEPAKGDVSKQVAEQQVNLAQEQLYAQEQAGQAAKAEQDTKRTVTEGEFVTGAEATPQELTEINMVAATAEPSDKATTRGQLELLQKDWEDGKIPPYASAQIRAANAVMLQRGIGASSMAGQAIMQQALESSVQIAMADAKAFQTFEMASLTNKQQAAVLNAQMRATILGQELTNRQQAAVINASRVTEANNMTFTAEQTVALENAKMMQQMNLTNLSNKQQTALSNAATFATLDKANLDARMQAQITNAQNFLQMDMANLNNSQQARTLEYQSAIQGMFSDQAAQNAAQQFNATSQMQIDQFYTELNTQVEQANATRNTNMAQFNASQENAMAQFRDQMNFNRGQFNANAQLQINQSNAEWRRQVNTANTAEQNNRNRMQYQTLMNVTAQSQNNLWNFYRDCASWMMQTGESREGRAHAAAIVAMQIAGIKSMYREEFKNNLLLQLAEDIGTIITS